MILTKEAVSDLMNFLVEASLAEKPVQLDLSPSYNLGMHEVRFYAPGIGARLFNFTTITAQQRAMFPQRMEYSQMIPENPSPNWITPMSSQSTPK